MADPALAACVLPAPGAGFDIPQFLHDAGTVYMIAEAVSEEAPVAPLFAAMASEIHWIAAQIGQASPVGPAGPAAADGPGRGHPDLPGPAAVLAVGLRRQGHPGRRRRARRGPARRAVGRARPPGRARHQLGEGVPARHHRRHHAAGGEHAVRAGVVEGPRPGPRHPPRRRDPGHDPPAARRVRPGHPRRLRPGHRPAAPRLAQPRLPPRPPPARRRPARAPARAPWSEPVIPRSPTRRPGLRHTSSGTDHDQQRPDRRDPGPARRPPRAAHPAQPHPGRAHSRPHRAHRRPPSTPPTPTATSPNRRRSGGTSRPTDEPNPSPACAPGSSTSTGPATATWPPRSARAGKRTTCACTRWTSRPACGPSCTCSPCGPRSCCPPRPNTRPASCPPWPTSSRPKPSAAVTPAAPHRPAPRRGAGHDRRHLRQARYEVTAGTRRGLAVLRRAAGPAGAPAPGR